MGALELAEDGVIGVGVGQQLPQVGFDLAVVVIGLDPARSVDGDPVGPMTETLLRRADFEVIVDRPSPAPVD